MEKLLWTYEDIAERIGYKPRYVRDKVMKDDAAPLPVLPGRFDPEEVKRFLNVLRSRRRLGCNRSSHAEDRASQTSGKDQEH